MTDVEARPEVTADAGPEVDTSGVPFRVETPVYIPARRYYDQEFYELENEKLWMNVWQPACRLDEIPEVGHFVEYKILDQSIIVVRESEDNVTAFYNSCRHRGTALGLGTGSFTAEQIVCPYHGWRWDLKGNNTFVYARQEFEPECLAKDEVDLASIRTGIKFGFVWVNFNPDGEEFEESFNGIGPVLELSRLDLMHVNWWRQIEFKGNWKIAQEAFFEAYHVMQTHPEMAMFKKGDEVNPAGMAGYGTDPQGHGWASMSTAMSRMEGSDKIEVLKDVSMQVYAANSSKVLWDGGKSNITQRQVEIGQELLDKGLSDEEYFTEYYTRVYTEAAENNVPIPPPSPEMTGHCTVFPNFTMVTSIGNSLLYRSRPTGPDTCIYDFWSLTIPPEGTPITRAYPGTGPEWDELWFLHQDANNIERQQIGVHTNSFTQARLAPFLELMISNWHEALDRKLAE